MSNAFLSPVFPGFIYTQFLPWIFTKYLFRISFIDIHNLLVLLLLLWLLTSTKCIFTFLSWYSQCIKSIFTVSCMEMWMLTESPPQDHNLTGVQHGAYTNNLPLVLSSLADVQHDTHTSFPVSILSSMADSHTDILPVYIQVCLTATQTTCLSTFSAAWLTFSMTPT